MLLATPRVGIPTEFDSPADIAIIVVAALVVLGPKKPSQLLTELGQVLRERREMTHKK